MKKQVPSETIHKEESYQHHAQDQCSFCTSVCCIASIKQYLIGDQSELRLSPHLQSIQCGLRCVQQHSSGVKPLLGGDTERN